MCLATAFSSFFLINWNGISKRFRKWKCFDVPVENRKNMHVLEWVIGILVKSTIWVFYREINASWVILKLTEFEHPNIKNKQSKHVVNHENEWSERFRMNDRNVPTKLTIIWTFQNTWSRRRLVSKISDVEKDIIGSSVSSFAGNQVLFQFLEFD